MALGAPGPAAAQEGNAEEGAEVFKKCRACHDVGPDAKNKVGPVLNDIIGRKAGTIEGFAYSEANKTAGGKGLTWTEDVLLKYLENPLDLHAGHEDGVRRPQGRAGSQGPDRLPEEVLEEIAPHALGPSPNCRLHCREVGRQFGDRRTLADSRF